MMDQDSDIDTIIMSDNPSKSSEKPSKDKNSVIVKIKKDKGGRRTISKFAQDREGS